MRKEAFILLSKRRKTESKIEATYNRTGHRGSMLFIDAYTPEGKLDHFWVNRRQREAFAGIKPGDRVSFYATVCPYRSIHGEDLMRLEDIREVRIHVRRQSFEFDD